MMIFSIENMNKQDVFAQKNKKDEHINVKTIHLYILSKLVYEFI